MKLFLYVFLLIRLTEHSKSTNSSSMCKNTPDCVQQIAPADISTTTTADKQTNANVVFSTNSQSFNKWGYFNSWSCNTPQFEEIGTAQLFIKSSVESKQHLYRILVFGGSLEVRTSLRENYENQDTTWIYYEETNSWRTIDNVSNRQPAMSNPYLVTLCSSHTIVVHPDAINNSWIFDFQKLDWKKITIVGDPPDLTGLYPSDFVAVAVNSSDSLCSCREDVVLFMFGKQSLYNVVHLYRLSCVVEHTTYRWKKSGYSNSSDKLHLHSVVTSPEKKTLFFVVGSCIWTFFVEKSI